MSTLDHRGRPRVAVTGVGLHTPAGVGLEPNWAAMLAGASAARTVTSFDVGPLAVKFACQVHDFDPTTYLGPKESRRVDRGSVVTKGEPVATLNATVSRRRQRA